MKKYSQLSDPEKVEFLESVLESIPDMVLVKGENSRLLWANKSFRECYGMTIDEFYGVLDAEHSDPDHTLQYVQDDKFVYENNKVLNIPSEPVTWHDGKIEHYHTVKAPITDQNNNVNMTVGVSRLVSDSETVSQLEESRWATADSSERLHQFVSSLATNIALVDMNLNYVSASRGWREFFSLADNISATAVLPTLADRDQHWENVFKVCLTGENYGESAARLLLEDGSEEVVNWQIAPWQSSEGRILGLVLSIEIVTDALRQAALLDRTQRLAKVGGWEYDVTRNSLWWSDEVYRIHEMNIGEPIDIEHAINFYATEYKDLISQAVKAAIEDQTPWDLELQIVTTCGERKWVRAQGSPVISSGVVVKLIGSFQDVSKRKLAEKAAEIEKGRFELAIQGGSLGLWDWDLLTNDTYFNERWFSMLGYSSDELESSFKTWEELVHPEDIEQATESLERYLKGELKEYSSEIRMRSKNGAWRWVYTRGTIVERDHSGVPLRLVGTHLDITDSKQTQEALLNAKNAAEEANKTKSQFLANMSHEIRTPMNGVLGMTQLLLSSELSSEDREVAETLLHSTHSLLNIVDDILDFSKIGDRKLELYLEPFSMTSHLDGIRRMFSAKAAEKNIELKTNIDELDMFKEHVIGDKSRLKQILVNLIGNALKFTDIGGKVELCVSPKLLEDESLLVSFAVHDNGIGIPQNKLTEIFEAFAQGDSGVTRQYGGTGLGLTISAQLVELMGGRLTVSSEVGSGSQFSFDLIFTRGEEVNDQEPVTKVVSLRPITTSLSILVAEDNLINQNVAKRLLEREGHIVTIVSNGKEAVDAVQQSPFDVILMDIQMPIMDGVEATKKIRLEQSSKEIPIIALTAHAMQGDREKYLSEGLDEYISKPFSKTELLAAIAKVTESSSSNSKV